MTLLEKEGIDKFPNVVIIGDKKLADTDLEYIIRNDIFDKRVCYLSVEEGIDYTAFKKANVYYSKGVYLFSQLHVDNNSENVT
jgi:hypothetical protein